MGGIQRSSKRLGLGSIPGLASTRQNIFCYILPVAFADRSAFLVILFIVFIRCNFQCDVLRKNCNASAFVIHLHPLEAKLAG